MRKKILNLALILMLISAMFILTGCGEEENNADDVENIEEEISINEEKIELNPELEGVCAFAVKVKDEEIFHGGIGESKIIALLDDGTEVDITDYTTTDYRGFDYDNGKLYFNNESNFYEIDLTQGNGVYEVEDLCTIESASSLTNKILIYNEKIYFKNSDRQLAVYDMSTNELDIISENDEEIGAFYIDKENGIIYYDAQTPQYCIKKYEIANEENIIIDQNDYTSSYTYKGSTRVYYMDMMLYGFWDGVLIYYSRDDSGKYSYYLYDVETGEKECLTDLDPCFKRGMYSDGKIYYNATTEAEYEGYADYVFKVYDDGEIISLIDGGNDVDFGSYMFDLGNGKIQTVCVWGQSDDSNGHQAYLIDKETFEVEETEEAFISVCVIKD